MNTERLRTIALVAATMLATVPAIGRGQVRAQAVRSGGTVPAADAAVAVSTAIEATARVAGAAVVEIFTMAYTPTEGRVAGTNDLVRTQRSSGSGAIVDASGYIVTNAHVVRGAQRIRVEVPTVPTGGSILAAAGPAARGPHRRPRSRDRPGRRQGRGDRPADAAVRRLGRLARRAARGRARQPARLPQLGLARRGQRRGAPARARIADGLRAERRGHQLGQQRRAARRPARPHRRHQHPGGVARWRGRRRARLRGAEQHRPRRLRADPPARPRPPRRHRRPAADADAGCWRPGSA